MFLNDQIQFIYIMLKSHFKLYSAKLSFKPTTKSSSTIAYCTIRLKVQSVGFTDEFATGVPIDEVFLSFPFSWDSYFVGCTLGLGRGKKRLNLKFLKYLAEDSFIHDMVIRFDDSGGQGTCF